MPRQECNHMEGRLRFVARLLDGGRIAPLCREFGIARETGCKIFNRYKRDGASEFPWPKSPGFHRGTPLRPIDSQSIGESEQII